MAILTGYFNSVNGDRKYNAETMSNYYVGILTRGVLANYGGQFVVKESNSMGVQVQTGRAFFSDGKYIESTAVENLTIDASDVILNRIDRIVLRKDVSDGVRAITIEVKKGTPSSSPQPPAVESTSYIEELSLATVAVNAHAETITAANITDTRPNSSVCGFVTGVVEQLDLTEAFNQYRAAAKEDIAQNQAMFNEWFQSIKDTIATSTLIRSYESTHTTTADGETVIPIGIPQFNRTIDIFQVYINGMKLVETQDYTINSNTQITLTKELCKNTPVNFVVYKSIDGSDAETVVSQVHELQTLLDAQIPKIDAATAATTDSGWQSLTLGSGVTQYSAANYPVRCRKIGKQVYIEGLISNAVALNVTVATIPNGYRPSKNQIVAVPVSKKTAGRSANLIFYATGEIKIDSVNSSEGLVSSDYVSLKTSYLID